METKKIICRTQVRTIEDVVDAWKADHECAMAIRDIEDIFPVCQFLKDQLGSWVADFWHCTIKGKIKDPFAEADVILFWFAEALKAMDKLGALVGWAEKRGYTVDNSGKFAETVNDIRKMQHDLRSRWPLPDEKQIEQARHELDNGEYQSAEDMLRELQGSDSA